MKTILYIFLTLFFGLMQFWVIALIILFKQHPIRFIDIFKDGGLFFFSSSVAATTFVIHCKVYSDQRNKKVNQIIAGLIFLIIILLINTAGFYTAFNIDLTKKIFSYTFNSIHLAFGFVSILLVLIYGCIIEKKAAHVYRVH